MNSTTSARNFNQALAALALTGVAAAFALGLALNALALPLFAVFAAAVTVLIVAHDYTPRASYRTAAAANVVAFRAAAERMPLAA